ncbi:toll/interleukin-1 receptor domain-containing protein [Nonomuraea ferruginea]
MIQAWDFVPGTNFIDFMDRGVSEAGLVVAVLSRNYLSSRYGRMEWQAALRADPDNPSNKLVTIRLEDVRLEGLLSTITWVDLLGVTDAGQARALLLGRVREALAGRAKPEAAPAVPHRHEDGRRSRALAAAARRAVQGAPHAGVGAEVPARHGPASGARVRQRAPHRRSALRPGAARPR